MADAINKAIRKVRGKPKLIMKVRDTSRDWLVDIKAEAHKQSIWEKDKINRRDQNFNKLLVGQKKYQEAKQAEKDRQTEIGKARLKNLKKARRVRMKNLKT